MQYGKYDPNPKGRRNFRRCHLKREKITRRKTKKKKAELRGKIEGNSVK
jgi:hypothetical protein